MLRISVELLPGGNPVDRRALSTMSISNISDLAATSDYEVEVLEAENGLTGSRPRLCSCVVKNHVRAQSVWALVAAAIRGLADAECTEF
jgi:hypothetical protein